jgi:hypothetical protein
MKYHINKMVILIIISFFITQFGNHKTEAIEPQWSSDLLTLASVIQGENIQVDEWSIYAREKLPNFPNQKNKEEYLKTIQKKFPKWEWTESKDQRHWEAEAVSPSTSAIQEKIRFVSTPTNQRSQAYLIYEVKGHAWSDHMESFLKTHLSSTFSDIFQGKPTIFSCIKAEIDDKMVQTLSPSIYGLLKAFNANEIESLSENAFISVTAASPLFAESLKSNHENINLQLAMRKGLGAKTTLVVGTPIITIEY